MGPAQGDRSRAEIDDVHFAAALRDLDQRMRAACAGAAEWPDRIGAGIYAGVDYLVESPAVAAILLGSSAESPFGSRFRSIVARMDELVSGLVPAGSRPTPRTPTASVAGITLLVGEHLRLGRLERLSDLRPDLHLLMLLPYLGFEEAKRWVKVVQESSP